MAVGALLACGVWAVAGPVLAGHAGSSPGGEVTTSVSGSARPGVLRLDWSVPPGHYVFRNKLEFRSRTPGVVLGAVMLPPGTVVRDDFLGDLDVLEGRFLVEVPYTVEGGPARSVALEATSQSCERDGDCRPAQVRRLEIALPGGAAALLGDAGGASGAPAASAVEESPLDILGRLGKTLAGDSGEDEFLDPDVAFVPSAEVADDGTVRAHWTIADGYYLYRDKFQFALAGGNDLDVGEAEMPPGKIKDDEFFGRMEVYYHAASAQLPLRGTGAPGALMTLELRYQGCADAGLCYPPITKQVSLTLPPGAAARLAAGGAESPPTPAVAQTEALAQAAPAPPAVSAPSAADLALPEQDRLARTLEQGSTWLVLLTFFGLGLLLTFTPCVLPMIPILSSIIAGQGPDIGPRRAFVLSGIYVLAMAATYSVAGMFAGAAGAGLQSVFQTPWVLWTFSAVFVLLALSMFGFYELQVPASLQARLGQWSNAQRGGTYAGVAVMGFLSALIVGPCVAAPLAGALIYISRSGDVFLGGAALFTMALGMGVPLLVVGTSAGKLLPRAGPWMDAVKAVFGVLLLGTALYLVYWLVPDWLLLLLCASLLIVCAVYMGALDALPPAASGWRRLWKGAGLMMAVYGVLLMVGAATGSGNLLQPLRGLAGGAVAESAHLSFRQVKGSDGLDAALRAAAAEGRSVMLDYYADWCISCKEMEKFTFSDPGVRAALAGVVLLQTDVTANDDADQGLLRRFGLFGPPAILFFGPDGRERDRFRVVGFMSADEFRAVVERATAGGARFSAELRSRLRRRLG